MSHSPIVVNSNCCESPAIPEDIDILNCDGTTTTETFPSPLERVVIVQDKPFVVCADRKVDFEVGCSSVDGRTVVRTYVQNEDGTITSAIFEEDGVSPVIDGSRLTKCEFDVEDVEDCFQLIGDQTTRYKRIIYVNVETQALIGTLWFDLMSGTLISEPSGIEPCNNDCVLKGSQGTILDWNVLK